MRIAENRDYIVHILPISFEQKIFLLFLRDAGHIYGVDGQFCRGQVLFIKFKNFCSIIVTYNTPGCKILRFIRKFEFFGLVRGTGMGQGRIYKQRIEEAHEIAGKIPRHALDPETAQHSVFSALIEHPAHEFACHRGVKQARVFLQHLTEAIAAVSLL